jgi:hypothetical protein
MAGRSCDASQDVFLRMGMTMVMLMMPHTEADECQRSSWHRA